VLQMDLQIRPPIRSVVMKPRLVDLAAHAGVSEATVSRVLNGRPGVSEAKRHAVLTALDLLGYERPTRLSTRTAGLVGLVVPELDNPVFPRFAQAVETALVEHRFTPVLCTLTPGGVHEDDYVELLLERGVAGIIFASGVHAIAGTNPGRYQALRERGVPIVLVNGYLEGVDAPFVSTDDAAAVELAVAHLAGLGHERIGLAVGPERYTPVQRKIAAFHAALRRHVPSVPAEDVQGLVECTQFRVEGGAAATHALAARGATAVVCGSDVMALGAVRAARDRGLRVPQDFSVVGYDDSPLVEFTDPPLTTVRAPLQAMAEAAVQALLSDVAGEPAPRAEYVFRPELVVRASTAARTAAAVTP
jgi:DNA-binding LacI/PurR family transcriptional regulator